MVKELLEINKIVEAYEKFKNMHPHDQATVYLTLDINQRRLLDKQLSDDELSEMLIYINPEDSANILLEFNLIKQKALLEQMPIDDAVDVIEELPLEDQTVLLDVLKGKAEFESLLTYKDYEAGSLMTSKFLKLESGIDIKDAMKILIANAPNVESINTLFVVEDEQYIGTLHLNKLIKAKSPLIINELLEKTPEINDLDEIDVAIHKMREYGLYEIAVVNEFKHLVGIITLDDAIEAYEKGATTDFMQFAALSEEENLTLVASAKKRIPWLVILLLASIPIAIVSMAFEEVLLSFAILALFQPLILDASGDVATQTLAVTLRKLNQTDGASLKDGIKEVITGTINGLILGIASALITYLLALAINISNPFETSLVVGVSLLITVMVGPIFGYLIPVILNKLKIDPAVASGPFITTLVDLVSLIVFFGLASLVLIGG